ncbi:hypothetical protein WICMUC_001710 [Wickerhamomyces mucosus]|uniref:Uncharacterized protein n=1 Tax=Wickerhamomyces mucosus TaxID=1378264 RepID=A0A9P8PU33_9ASCO|nr:hypothetical protein WICMUC_001710 [Wickerhamomyces mucosus]
MNKEFHITNTQREILSGLTAGFLTTTVTHPLDLLKIRLQLDPSSNTKVFQNFKKQINLIYVKYSFAQTFQNLYRGILPNLIGNSLAWSIYFTSYRTFKDYRHKEIERLDSNLTSLDYLTSAFAAGSLTAFLTNPIWVLKTRILSTNKSDPGAYTNLFDGIKRILKEEGILGFWKGFLPSLLGVSQGALQFTIYDTLKYQIKNDDHVKLEIYEYLYMSCTSKIISLMTIYPIQMMKSRLQAYENITERKKLRTLIKQIYYREGIQGFYKGVVPNIIRVLPATCITFSVYEEMKKIF